MSTPAPNTEACPTATLPATHGELHQLVTQLSGLPIRPHDAGLLTRALLRLNGTADGLLTFDHADEALAAFGDAFAATTCVSTLTPEMLQNWCEGAGSLADQHYRRATCSVALVPLIAHGLLPARTNPLPHITLAPMHAAAGEGWIKVRPLLPLELLATRLATSVGRDPVPRAAMVAVSEGGAATSELAALLAPALQAWPTRHIELPGHTKIASRRVQLDGWRARAVDTHLEVVFNADTIRDPHRPVFYGGHKDGTSNAAQASSSGVLLHVLKIAGLGQDKNVKPHSIRFGGVRTQLQDPLDAHPVQAARTLGLSITAAMRYLGLAL